jgi:hypothetical protein
MIDSEHSSQKGKRHSKSCKERTSHDLRATLSLVDLNDRLLDFYYSLSPANSCDEKIRLWGHLFKILQWFLLEVFPEMFKYFVIIPFIPGDNIFKDRSN